MALSDLSLSDEDNLKIDIAFSGKDIASANAFRKLYSDLLKAHLKTHCLYDAYTELKAAVLQCPESGQAVRHLKKVAMKRLPFEG